MLDAMHDEWHRLSFDVNDALDPQQLVTVVLAQQFHHKRQLGPVERLLIAKRERADAVGMGVVQAAMCVIVFLRVVSMICDGGPIHFLFEGAKAGAGDLVLAVSRHGEEVARSTIRIEILPIEEMYERAHIRNVSQLSPRAVSFPQDLESFYFLDNSPLEHIVCL